ncbi:MAG: hypothetical protein ACWGMZ_12605, partial [Thermoguttaceae bacterium]
CQEQLARLGQLQTGRGEADAMLAAAQASAVATLGETELAADLRQHELAALMQLPSETALPMPVDRPHVGAYRTNFQALFAERSPPDRARLIDRTLPLCHMAIDQRAIAVQAAQDALAAAAEGKANRDDFFASLLGAENQLLQQQRLFIEAVCRYNREIAEYAILVAAPNATPRELVGFMIKSTAEPLRAGSMERQEGVQPTSLNQPVPAAAAPAGYNQGGSTIVPRTPGATIFRGNRPTTRWTQSPATMKNEPTLAPRRNPIRERETDESAPNQSRGLAPIKEKNVPTLAPPRSELKLKKAKTPESESSENKDGEQKIHYSVGDPFARRVQVVRKFAAELADNASEENASTPAVGANVIPGEAKSAAKNRSQADAFDASSALYPALVKASRAVRAKQLSLALNWDRSLPDGIGSPMTLVECVAKSPVGERRVAVEAFWLARRRAAEYQVLAQEIEFFDGLNEVVLQRRAEPQGPAAMLFLRSARRSALADLQDAQAALVEAQFELALHTQSVSEDVWPLPATMPHSGQYFLNLEAQPSSLVHAWPTRHLAAAIPSLSLSVQDHASAVVATDVARAAAQEKYDAEKIPLKETIEA